MLKCQFIQKVLVVAVVFVGLVYSNATIVTTDFEDGTSQGWTIMDPTASAYAIVYQGNPGYALMALDTMAGGSNPRIEAPVSYLGDLSGYDGIKWDEYIFYESNPDNCVRTSLVAILYGQDGTIYHTAVTEGLYEIWTERYVPFEAQYWVRNEASGNASFEDVLSNVVNLQFNMECSWEYEEAMIDNITLVPEPLTVLLFGLGSLVLRKYKQ